MTRTNTKNLNIQVPDIFKGLLLVLMALEIFVIGCRSKSKLVPAASSLPILYADSSPNPSPSLSPNQSPSLSPSLHPQLKSIAVVLCNLWGTPLEHIASECQIMSSAYLGKSTLIACENQPYRMGFFTIDDNLGRSAAREGFRVLSESAKWLEDLLKTQLPVDK